MNDEYILSKGYKEFEPSPFDGDGVITMFQKRFDDEIGKKYFITIKKWSWEKFGRADIPDYTYEFDTQLYQKDTRNPINIEWFSGWELDDVEKHLENLWNADEYDYYEVFY